MSQVGVSVGQSDAFYTAVLKQIGAPVTGPNLAVMRAWAKAEGSVADFNPFNTTQHGHGATFIGPGIASYPSLAEGSAAIAGQLKSLYPGIVAGFVASDPNRTIAEIVASPWAASHYGGSANYKASDIWQIYSKNPDVKGAADIGGALGVSGGSISVAPGSDANTVDGNNPLSVLSGINRILGKITSAAFGKQVALTGIALFCVIVGFVILFRKPLGTGAKAALNVAKKIPV